MKAIHASIGLLRALDRLGLRATLVAGVAFLLTVSTAAFGQSANYVAWVLADQPDAAIYTPYTPPAKYSFDSAGGPITVTRTEIGSYAVRFGKLFSNLEGTPNIQISGYNMSGTCISQVLDSSGSDLIVNVQCFDSRGVGTDAAFTVFYQARTAPFGNADRGLAFLFIDNGFSSEMVAAFNSTGARNSAVRNGYGSYTLTLPGLIKLGGDVQVTSFSLSPRTGSLGRCKVANWRVAGGGTTVNVRCYGTSGSPGDEQFFLGYAVDQSFGAIAGWKSVGAWALANGQTTTGVYTPNLNYQYNGFGTGHLTAQRTSTGLYAVTIPGVLTYRTSVALVTAYGENSHYCNLVNWTTSTINVACYDKTGALADSAFDVAFQTAK